MLSPLLIHGDCLEELPKLSDASIHLVAVDLPYGSTNNRWDIIIPMEPMWAEFKRLLVPGGVAVFTATQPFAGQLIMSNTSWFKYDLIWEKSVASGQLNVKKMPLRTHEHILVFYSGTSTYNEQLTEGIPYAIHRTGKYAEGSYGKQTESTKVNSGFRHAKSVIKVPNPRIKGGHPTQKPVALMEYLIKVYSNEGDVVLDCCMGSGTTGVACSNLNRQFVGIENNVDYFNVAKKRLLVI